MRENCFQDSCQVIDYVVVPESQNYKSLCFQPAVPFRVVVRGFRVLAAIQFDDQSRLKANEIDDIVTYRLLPLEFKTLESMSAQFAPDDSFGVCQLRA